MTNFQTCLNTSDAIPLYVPQQLYLKPISRLNISIQLPRKKMGKSISNLEVMEQLRLMIKPDIFCVLKVITTDLESIRVEAEVDDKNRLKSVVHKLNKKTIKLKEFSELLKIRASESKPRFPSRHEWDAFFHEAKDMNEMKPGERPDTLHISNLPIKWFVPYNFINDPNLKPSEKIFYHVFEKFGTIRCIDIPICDPHRNKMKIEVSGLQTFSFDDEHFFEGYVQFKDYIGFSKAMDALRGMKLLHKDDDETLGVNIIVDYDRTKHLSEASIRRREIVRDRLVKKDKIKEEHKRLEKEKEDRIKEAERKKKSDEKAAKEQRRRKREEKRKAKILAKLKVNSADEINDKIAKEEKKLLKAQRKLEAIRLVEALFQRIKLTRMKSISELEVHQQKENLNKTVEGRVILKSLLSGDQFNCKDSSSSESSVTNKQKRGSLDHTNSSADKSIVQNDWYPYLHAANLYPYQMGPSYSNSGLGGPLPYYPHLRGRGSIPGPSRGPRRYFRGRYRGGFRDILKSFFMKTTTIPDALIVNPDHDHTRDIGKDLELDQSIIDRKQDLGQAGGTDLVLAVHHLIDMEDLRGGDLGVVVNRIELKLDEKKNQDHPVTDQLIVPNLFLQVV
ncbi:hypothetical protein RN001_004217 [Aquatica leii]|uniref:A-kinase anchor protein 17A n=1 Tax=Aquatica leii TaxID=1421715 RepID=A0AAN7PBD5_9COLE|nr:hypothetical protein RN001_004217 [Aquatica leii]